MRTAQFSVLRCPRGDGEPAAHFSDGQHVDGIERQVVAVEGSVHLGWRAVLEAWQVAFGGSVSPRHQVTNLQLQADRGRKDENCLTPQQEAEQLKAIRRLRSRSSAGFEQW
jgi:hypothetical protein